MKGSYTITAFSIAGYWDGGAGSSNRNRGIGALLLDVHVVGGVCGISCPPGCQYCRDTMPRWTVEQYHERTVDSMGFFDRADLRPQLQEVVQRQAVLETDGGWGEGKWSLGPALDQWAADNLFGISHSLDTERAIASIRRFMGESTSQVDDDVLLFRISPPFNVAGFVAGQGVDAWRDAMQKAKAAQPGAAGHSRARQAGNKLHGDQLVAALAKGHKLAAIQKIGNVKALRVTALAVFDSGIVLLGIQRDEVRKMKKKKLVEGLLRLLQVQIEGLPTH